MSDGPRTRTKSLTTLCATKNQKRDLTAALRELGILPRCGHLVITVNDNQVVDAHATEFKFLTRKQEMEG